MSATVPTLRDAVERRAVRLPDGRRAHLWSISAHRGPDDRGRTRPSRGALARVRLPSGSFLSVPLLDLTVITEDDPT